MTKPQNWNSRKQGLVASNGDGFKALCTAFPAKFSNTQPPRREVSK